MAKLPVLAAAGGRVIAGAAVEVDGRQVADREGVVAADAVDGLRLDRAKVKREGAELAAREGHAAAGARGECEGVAGPHRALSYGLRSVTRNSVSRTAPPKQGL